MSAIDPPDREPGRQEERDRRRAAPGTRDVDNPVRRLRTDLDLNIDSEKAALLGGVVTPVMYKMLPPKIEPRAAEPRDSALA